MKDKVGKVRSEEHKIWQTHKEWVDGNRIANDFATELLMRGLHPSQRGSTTTQS